MKKINLEKATVVLNPPVEVARGKGFMWFPNVHRFPTGELMAGWSMNEDSAVWVSQAGISFSEDNGKTWGPYPYIGTVTHTSCAMPGPDGSLIAYSYNVFPDDDHHGVRADIFRYEKGGKRVVWELKKAHIKFKERAMKNIDTPWWNANSAPYWCWCINDSIVEPEPGRLIMSMYGYFESDGLKNVLSEEEFKKLDEKSIKARYSIAIVESKDGGINWEHISCAGRGRDFVHTSEGPCESAMTILANGDILLVCRTGGFVNNLHQTISHDGGYTWEKLKPIEPKSVQPGLTRLDNDTLVLSTGRPGIFVWISADGRGEKWEQINLVDVHNSMAPDELKIKKPVTGSEWLPVATTSYTEIAKIGPDRLLVIYDTTPHGWTGVPKDSPEFNRIFVMEIEVVRKQ